MEHHFNSTEARKADGALTARSPSQRKAGAKRMRHPMRSNVWFLGVRRKNEAMWPCCTDMFGVYCGKLPWHIAATGSNLRLGSAEHLLMVHPSARAVYMPLQISPLMGWRLSCNPATVETQDTMAMPVFLLHPPLITPFDGAMPCPEFDFSMVPARYSTGTLR